MLKEIKFTIEESNEWDCDIKVMGSMKHDGEVHNVTMYGRVNEAEKIKKRIATALGRNITMLMKQKERKKNIADIVGITYEEREINYEELGE